MKYYAKYSATPALAVWVCWIKSSWTRHHRVICLISILQNVKIEGAAVEGWGLTASMRRLQEHKTMLLGRIAGFLPLPEENGKRMKLQARYCLHFSLLLSPSLALSLCIPFYSISFLSLLPCPALPSGIIFILFLLPQGPVCPNSLAWAKLAFWSSWFQAPQVSQTFLGIALLSHSHFYPLPLPQVPDTENVTMRFLRSIRLSGRWVVGTAFLHAPSSSQIRLLLLELYNSWQGSGWADRWYLPGLVFWTNQFLIFWSLFKKINAQVSLSISDLWSPQPPPHWPYYSWGSEKENLFYQGFQGWAKSPRGCWGWRDVSRFMPIGVRKVPLFDLVSNQSIWIVSINMAINMLMELPIQLIHYA